MRKMTMLCEVDDCINTLSGPASDDYTNADNNYNQAYDARCKVMKANDDAIKKMVQISREILRREIRKVNKFCSCDVYVDAKEIYDHSINPHERKVYLTLTVFAYSIRHEVRVIPGSFMCIERAAKRLAQAVLGAGKE